MTVLMELVEARAIQVRYAWVIDACLSFWRGNDGHRASSGFEQSSEERGCNSIDHCGLFEFLGQKDPRVVD